MHWHDVPRCRPDIKAPPSLRENTPLSSSTTSICSGSCSHHGEALQNRPFRSISPNPSSLYLALASYTSLLRESGHCGPWMFPKLAPATSPSVVEKQNEAYVLPADYNMKQGPVDGLRAVQRVAPTLLSVGHAGPVCLGCRGDIRRQWSPPPEGRLGSYFATTPGCSGEEDVPP